MDLNLTTFLNMKIKEQSDLQKEKLKELFLFDFFIFFSFITHLKNEHHLQASMLSHKKNNQQHFFYEIVFNDLNNKNSEHILLYQLMDRNDYYKFNEDLFSVHFRVMFNFEEQLNTTNNSSIVDTSVITIIDDKLLWLNNFLTAIDKIEFKSDIHQLFLDYSLPSKDFSLTKNKI